MKGLAWGLLAGLAAGLALAAVALGAWWHATGGLDSKGPPSPPRERHLPRPAPQPAAAPPEVTRTIYLNREGAELSAGDDDARQNRSSIVRNAGREQVSIPPFGGSYRQWEAIVECVRQQFAAYDVRVVDQRPVDTRYVMAVVGGRPDDVGAEGTHGGHSHRITGLAPFNGKPVSDAVVLVFSRALRRRVRVVCETAAMEIAHAYGLDHTRHCKDVMSYMSPCGRRSFLDREVACGEHEDRPCKHDTPTQNSRARLLEVLGPADGGGPGRGLTARAGRQ